MKKFLLYLFLLVYIGLLFMCYNNDGSKDSANTYKIWYDKQKIKSIKGSSRNYWFFRSSKFSKKRY